MYAASLAIARQPGECELWTTWRRDDVLGPHIFCTQLNCTALLVRYKPHQVGVVIADVHMSIRFLMIRAEDEIVKFREAACSAASSVKRRQNT